MISILVGTNRPHANSRKVGLALLGLYSAVGVKAQIIDLAELPAEIFSPDAYAEKPESFKPFSDAILASSGLHLVCPEYNGGFPGVLKYFIDMLPFPESFEGRPVAFTGVAAGIFGALRPIEQIQQIFGYRNAYIYPNRVFVMKVHESLNDAGELTDEKLISWLDEQAKGFAEYVAKLSGNFPRTVGVPTLGGPSKKKTG